MDINNPQELREFQAQTILYGVACERLTHEDAARALKELGYLVDLEQPDRGPFYMATDTRINKLVKIEV